MKEIKDYLWKRFSGLPITEARDDIVSILGSMLGEEEAMSLQAISQQAYAGVKGEKIECEGCEAKPNTFDAGAVGGSLGIATGPTLMGVRE